MEQRVERDLIRPCRFMLQSQSCVAVGLLVPALICAGISAASTLLHGNRAGRNQDHRFFVEFVRRYMHADLRQPLHYPTDPRVTDYADWLYRNVRCGLSHAFALEWGHIEGPSVLATYTGQSAAGQPQVNQNELVEDFARGWGQYLGAVSADPASVKGGNFEKRFDQVFHD
jgi:hypothetical protein